MKVSIVGSLRDREVACSASDRQGSNFESCVWRRVSSQSSHHPQEVLLAQFSLYVHKGGLKPDSFHFRGLPSEQNAEDARTQFSEGTLLSKPLLDKYAVFLAEFQAKSDMASYFINVKRMIDIIKCLVTADRESNWPMHVSCIEESMAITGSLTQSTTCAMAHTIWKRSKY